MNECLGCGLTVAHLSLGIGAKHLEGLCQGNPFSGLLRVTLAVQGREEHDKVQPQGLMMATLSNATSGEGEIHN